MIPWNKAVATSYRLSVLSSNHVSICSGLAAILNGMFKAMWLYLANGERVHATVSPLTRCFLSVIAVLDAGFRK